MKKYLILTSVLALTACGGGGGAGGDGANGAPGKSAYEIWLDQGNTGTEQDFLDSLVANNDASVVGGSQYASLLQEAQAKGGYTITQMSWPEHGGFYRIEKDDSTTCSNEPTYGNDANFTTHYVYNEKELTLANYGVKLTKKLDDREFSSTTVVSYDETAWINNREGIGANAYIPDNGTVFRGGTLAYLSVNSYSSNYTEPTFIKGSAEYTYSPTNPKLILDFDNYYRFVFQNGVSATFSGTNNTGNTRYNLANGGGDIIKVNDDEIPTQSGKIGFVKKDSVEEVVGTYDVVFRDDSRYYKIYAPNGVFYLIGAFGGTKQ